MALLEKKTYGYRERDEEKRQAFLERLAQLKSEKIVYVDESGMVRLRQLCLWLQ